MIEFSGELSEDSKKYLLKKNAALGFVISSIIDLIATGIIVTIAVLYNLWIILLFLLPFVIVVLLVSLAPYIQQKKTLKLIVPSKITIDKKIECIRIYFSYSAVVIEKKLSKIKKVVDQGKFYYIKFRFPKIDGFLCQKDLLKEGTIEEFETLFQGKLVRKITKN